MSNEVLPFFIYGAARENMPLHYLIEPIVKGSLLVTVEGYELAVLDVPDPKFPYMVSGGKRDKVWGELLLLHNGTRLADFVNMEQQAGYDLEGVEVKHHRRGMSPYALAFVWNRGLNGLRSLGNPSWLAHIHNYHVAR
jgi:hypothetical protein